MQEDKNNTQPEESGESENLNASAGESKMILYLAAVCFGLGVVLLGLSVGLSFAVKNVGVPMLIASMVTELAAVSFLNAQKRKKDSKLRFALTIASYIVMAIGLIIFLVGTSISGSTKK